MSLRKLRVRLRVQLDDAWRAQDRLQVYTDWGDGTVDAAKPLLSRSIRSFPMDIRRTVHHAGYGLEPYGMTPYGGDLATPVLNSGYGFDPYGEVAYGETARYLWVDVLVPQAHGSWKFAAQAIDGAGNEQGALQDFIRFLSGDDPAPLGSFSYDSYDSGTDVVTFAVSV